MPVWESLETIRGVTVHSRFSRPIPSPRKKKLFSFDCKTIPAPPGCLFTVTGTVGWLYAHGEIWEGGQDGVSRASSSGITHGGLNWFTSC